MDRWVRNATMATAKVTTRRDFLSKLARGVVGAGLGASFLFGGQRFAFATNNCTTVSAGGNCGTDPCPGGDSEGCSGALTCGHFGLTCGLDGVCPSGYTETAHWTCCCGGKLYHCRDCSGGVQCRCEGGGTQSC